VQSRVEAAEPDGLRRWSKRMLTADTLEAVFR